MLFQVLDLGKISDFFTYLPKYIHLFQRMGSIPFSYSVPIAVQYDKSFKTAWGDKSLFAIRGMLAIVQNIYRWDTWKVKLEFRLVSQINYNSRHSFEITRFWTPDDTVTEDEADNL